MSATSIPPDARFPRGSEWRRWDLHVHSPESILNNQFGADDQVWDRYVHALFTNAIEKGIAAIGITDYFFIEGYKKLKLEYLADRSRLERIFHAEIENDPAYLDKVFEIAVFPNIEFRIEKYLAPRKGNSEKRLTVHVLFSDEVSIDDIEHNFLGRLHIPYRGKAQMQEEKLPLTYANLKKLGERLQEEHPPFRTQLPLVVGCTQATVDDDDILTILSSTSSLFQNKFILVLAIEYLDETSWDGAGHQFKKILYQKCDMIFASNAKTITWAASPIFAKEFGRAKACIWGSDAHSLATLFEPAELRYCWIKADVTFAGLRQVLNEPAERCYIGECPPALQKLREHKKPYITSLSFMKRSGSSLTEKWFDGLSLEFNPSMVTIIGNKGAGKSALADSLALLGVPNVDQQHFSFLRAHRFRRREADTKLNRAEEFEAQLAWSTGEQPVVRQLSHERSQEDLPRVHYLPQGYLERLCNEQEEDAQKELKSELDRVIFSHIKPSERLGKTSLEDLIDFRADEVIRSISSLKRHLRDLNHKISTIEKKISATSFAILEKKIEAKERDLQIHDQTKPHEISAPKIDNVIAEKTATALKRVDEIDHKISNLIEGRATTEQDLLRLNVQREKAIKIVERLGKSQEYYERFSHEMKAVLDELAIDASNILKVSVNKAPIEQFIIRVGSEMASKEALLDAANPDGFAKQVISFNQQKKTIQDALDAPNRQYQKYRTDLLNWEARRREIIGNEDAPDTLLYYKKQLDDVVVLLPKQLTEFKEQRLIAVRKIHEETCKRANIYRDFYRSVLEYSTVQGDNAGVTLTESFKVSFAVVLDGSKFIEQFFERVMQNVSGSFFGVAEGRKRLMDMMPQGTFDNGDSSIAFIEDVLSALYEDVRNANKKSSTQLQSIERQIRKGDVEGFYNFLFSMDYLEPKYVLRVGSKGLQELSPGERGLLLLYFYLVLDKDNSPLIIDQPEENLDNQSIKNILVPCIKTAKERRQLFIVTHNPNIAVVCDSEQVILTSIDKANGNEILCKSGSLEDAVISRSIVDVLEGTPPAFENRNLKYRTGGAIG